MKVISVLNKKVVLREKDVKNEYENIYTDKDAVYYYYKDVDMAIILGVNKDYYTSSHYKEFQEKMVRLHKDTTENYAKKIRERFSKKMPISIVEITLLADILGSDFVKEYKKEMRSETKTIAEKGNENIAIKVHLSNSMLVKEAERKFKNYEYLENTQIINYDKANKPYRTSVFCLMIDDLKIDIQPITKHWFKTKLKATIGDKVVDCVGTNNTAFEILKEIQKKLNNEGGN